MFFLTTRKVDQQETLILGFWTTRNVDSNQIQNRHSVPPWHSGIADSHFVVSLLIRNNKMGHRINKMDIHFNKVGHRNSKVGHRNNKVGVYETTKWGSVPVSPPIPPAYLRCSSLPQMAKFQSDVLYRETKFDSYKYSGEMLGSNSLAREASIPAFAKLQ